MSHGRSHKDEHEELYDELMEGADTLGVFVLETREGKPDIEFEVDKPDKPTINKLRRGMPTGFMDAVDMPDDPEDLENIEPEDIDLSKIDMDSMSFSEEATEQWLSEIAEHFNHEYYSTTEIRNIFDTLGEEYFMAAGTMLVEGGSGMGPVTGFREE